MRNREEIKSIARQTLIDHGLYSVPVNPVVLANRLGIRVHHAVFNERRYAGLTAKRQNGISILVKQDDVPERKRFTIAHEIAHCLLHLEDGPNEIIDTDEDLFRGSTVPNDNWKAERIREYEANVFAAELLMPADLVARTWKRLPSSNRTVEAIADIFGVSKEAMGYRIDDLGLIDD